MRRASSSASFFSPLLKRTFSSSTASPGATVTPSSQSLTSGTLRPSSSDSRAATGASESSVGRLALLGPAEVRHQHDPRAGRQRLLDRRQRGADARIAGDDAVLDRHVEVLADQHALAGERHVLHAHDTRRDAPRRAAGHGRGVHFARLQASVVSSMRFEKPHSLSYQAQTLTSVPSMTLVSVES